MPNIVPVDVNEPGAAAPLIDQVKAKLGKVPNLLATMAQSPAVLEAYLGFSGALDNGSLDAKRREQIALTVAGVNGCDYCASAHSYIAGVLGIDADEVARNLAGGAKDHKTAAILRFVGNVIRERGRSTNNASALNELRNEGVTDAELVEIIAAIALNIFTNYFNHIAATNVDFPLVTVDTERSAA